MHLVPVPFLRYSASKYVVTWSFKHISLKMPQYDRSYMTFYWSAIVSVVLCCAIFELFDV